MDYKDIEQLLERYWQCETSVEEEATLRDFFSKEEVPAHLLRYKNLFVYQQVQQEVGLGEDFDARILAEVEPVVVKAKRMSWRDKPFKDYSYGGDGISVDYVVPLPTSEDPLARANIIKFEHEEEKRQIRLERKVAGHAASVR